VKAVVCLPSVTTQQTILPNYVKTAVGEYSGKEFISTFKAANLKMIPDDYHVEIKFNGFSKFTSKTRKLVYYVAMDVEK
jgi:ribosomal protein S19